MNNTDFRQLVSTPRNSSNQNTQDVFHKPTAAASLLGSRKTSNIPMTPRTIRGKPSYSFAEQLEEERQSSTNQQKKFRSRAVPRGVKLAEGYIDRTADRNKDAEKDHGDDEVDKAQRIQALEEQMKLGQISRQTFETLRDAITGGDISSTHLVKGLDRKLLDRVRRGEDVMGNTDGSKSVGKEDQSDADEEFDSLEQREVAPVERETVEKKGTLAPAAQPKSVAGTKRSRNDILKELRESRRAIQESKPSLGSKFKRFGEKRGESRIEKDEKGREILISVDENGRVKRKVRKVIKDDTPVETSEPLGMEVPKSFAPKINAQDEDEEGDDIFAGVGDSYDPLGAVEDDDDTSDASDISINEKDVTKTTPTPAKPTSQTPSSEPSEDEALDIIPEHDHTKPPPPTEAQRHKNNYFNDKPNPTESSETPTGLNDPTLLATIKRAALIQAKEEKAQGNTENNKSKHFPGQDRDRDLDDIDMGFGASKFDDEDEDAGGSSRIKLSEWKGMTGDGDEDEEENWKNRGGNTQRKRGKKKKKGDKNSAKDVLGVIEGRKGN